MYQHNHGMNWWMNLKIGIRPGTHLDERMINARQASSTYIYRALLSYIESLAAINHFCKRRQLISHSIFILSLPLSSFCRFSGKKYIPMCFCGINQGASKRGLLRGLRVIRWPYFYFSDAVSDEGLLCLEKKATEHTSSQDQQQRQKNPINNSSRRMIFNFPPFEKRLIWHAEDEREINWH